MPPSGDRAQATPEPAAAPAAPALAPGAAPVARGATPAGLLALQGLAGNRAVTGLVQRVLLVVPTESLELGPSYADQTEDERIAAIREQLDSWWVGPIAETIIEDIWRSFGSELPAVAAKHEKEWLASLDRGAEIADLPAFQVLRRKFELDVRGTALSYMASNRELVEADRARLGLTKKEQQTTFGAMAQEAATAELQDVAREGADVIAAENALKQIDVGYSESDDVEGFTFRTYVTFDPARPPGPHVVVEDSARLKACGENWKRLQEARARIGRRSPAVFALMEHGGDPAAVAAASPADARKAAGLALGTVVAKIGDTETALSKNDLDWRELGAIHAQLFEGGTKGPSGEPWNDPVKKSVARDVVQAYEDHQWWVNLGLATAGAAAFLFSELATGGLATILWASAGVGLAATQAGMAWESYDDLATAAASSASPDQRLVTNEQADAAFTAAIIESVFAFIDVAGGVKLIAKSGVRLAAELGAASRARGLLADRAKALTQLDTMTAVEAATSVEDAVRELGAAEVIRRSGKGVDELAELVGRESDTGKRLLGQAPPASEATGLLGLFDRLMSEATRREGVETALRQLDELAPHEAAEAVAAALDVLGPQATLRRAGGWEHLAAVLDDGTEAATRLKTWREAVEKDLVAEFGPDRVLVTGSGGKLSNDLDVSVLGPNAARDRERVRMWLAARAGGSPDELRRLIYCDVFTDPLRMHPADLAAAGLSDSVREQINRVQAARQEQLLHNHRLYEARREERRGRVRHPPGDEGDVGGRDPGLPAAHRRRAGAPGPAHRRAAHRPGRGRQEGGHRRGHAPLRRDRRPPGDDQRERGRRLLHRRGHAPVRDRAGQGPRDGRRRRQPGAALRGVPGAAAEPGQGGRGPAAGAGRAGRTGRAREGDARARQVRRAPERGGRRAHPQAAAVWAGRARRDRGQVVRRRGGRVRRPAARGAQRRGANRAGPGRGGEGAADPRRRPARPDAAAVGQPARDAARALAGRRRAGRRRPGDQRDPARAAGGAARRVRALRLPGDAGGGRAADQDRGHRAAREAAGGEDDGARAVNGAGSCGRALEDPGQQPPAAQRTTNRAV
jgi:hypothetical protein